MGRGLIDRSDAWVIPPHEWAAWLAGAEACSPAVAPAWQPIEGSILLSICGATYADWAVHLWLDRLPLEAIASCRLGWEPAIPNHLHLHQADADNGRAPGQRHCCLNLELPGLDQLEAWWAHLTIQQAIWDPDRRRAALLQALGLPCHWLPPDRPSNGWLDAHPHGLLQAAALLGLPAPLACHGLCLGPGDGVWERALAAWEAASESQVLVYLPELPGLDGSLDQARTLARWLQAAAAGAEHVLLLSRQGFCGDPALGCLSAGELRHFEAPITPCELVAELVGKPMAAAYDPAQPEVHIVFALEQQRSIEATVVVSSYNYADRICAALDSVDRQTLAELELIIVDDASTDDSLDVITSWLQSHADRFARTLLLQHASNAGLAAARNTAFSHSSSAWCFVLDADNTLMPQALAACLQVAHAASLQTAVVHPLVEIKGARRLDASGAALISRLPWQRRSFVGGNYIDAMALIRTQAWRDVGGYSHIQGGWEDFDFWCKLIGAGYHGVLCPRVLARYAAHDESMTARSTSRQWRPLSRCLQQRHPWLRLPYAM